MAAQLFAAAANPLRRLIMKYTVEVTRISHARQTLEIEAESVPQAENLALKLAPEEEFSTYDTEYEISSVEKAMPEERDQLEAYSVTGTRSRSRDAVWPSRDRAGSCSLRPGQG
jgi:hypothetical protein